MEKQRNLGILNVVVACGVAADAHVLRSAGEGSVSRIRAALLTKFDSLSLQTAGFSSWLVVEKV